MIPRLKIFILEDEIDFAPRNGILTALEGHTLTLARSAADGRKLYDGSYDLLLLDHDMEGKFESPEHHNTGSQFCRWLAKTQYPRVQVIIHTQNLIGRKVMYDILSKSGWDRITEAYFSEGYVKFLRDRYGIRSIS